MSRRQDQDLGGGLALKVGGKLVRALVVQGFIVVGQHEGVVRETGVFERAWHLGRRSLRGRGGD